MLTMSGSASRTQLSHAVSMASSVPNTSTWDTRGPQAPALDDPHLRLTLSMHIARG